MANQGTLDSFQVVIDFELPFGYQETDGTLHKKGTMRLATAADEILPMRDPRVQQNPEYLPVIILARVVTQLGTLDTINTGVIEKLFRKDYEFLLDFYEEFNEYGSVSMDRGLPDNRKTAKARKAGE